MTLKILYVDDEQINLDLLKFHFEETCEVFTCRSGSEGLKILQEVEDITDIICDMKMKGINGLEFILEAQKYYPEKNYYLLSGFEITEDVRKAMKDGYVLEYFKKPCNFKTILKILKANHNHTNSTDSSKHNL